MIPQEEIYEAITASILMVMAWYLIGIAHAASLFLMESLR